MRALARRMQLNMGFGDAENDAFAYFCPYWALLVPRCLII
jgi:hypothetical protein